MNFLEFFSSVKIRLRVSLDLPLSFLIFGHVFPNRICKFCEDQMELTEASEIITDRFGIIKGDARDPPERWETFPGT